MTIFGLKMMLKSGLGPPRFQPKNWNAQARAGSKPFQLGSAQLGKFQLELITNTYTVHMHRIK